MLNKTETELNYLRLLGKQYPSIREASGEIIRLRAILNLPKGTEHFVSDIHGEYEAFLHLMQSASGVVREKIDDLFHGILPVAKREFLATLIYYPEEKLEFVARTMTPEEINEWYHLTLYRLIRVCRLIGSKYTRSQLRKAFPDGFEYVLDELIHVHGEDQDKRDYVENILDSIIETGQGADFVVAICQAIKGLSVDKLHIVGDIYDRGPRADIIMDWLADHHNVDFQWGNHDVLWMGAASGSRTLVATVLANSIHYNNLAVIEAGYGISLRPLALFAKETYAGVNLDGWAVKSSTDDSLSLTEKERELSAQMHKAITIILFKLESQKILRHPEYKMNDRLILEKINYKEKTVKINGKTYDLRDCEFPTVDQSSPYTLSPEEEEVITQMTEYFMKSEKLRQHVQLLYQKGSLYKVYNENLLFHGCLPMTKEKTFLTLTVNGVDYQGKAYFDFAQSMTRQAFYEKKNLEKRQNAQDFIWFLWAGRDSPLFGRDRMTTLERRLIADESAWTETKNHYYTHYHEKEVCLQILAEFGLTGESSHIINGHTPVKSKKGESPIKGGGRLIVIDGGFCKAYQPTTGIAGYTMVFNSQVYRLISHESFVGRKVAIENDWDIRSSSQIFERLECRLRISETDRGKEILKQVGDLEELLHCYQQGLLQEHRKKV